MNTAGERYQATVPDTLAVAARAYVVAEAARVVRNHRLWETYLVTHADIAPSHVDRDADHVEHALGEAMVARLERLLAKRATPMPASPHALDTPRGQRGRRAP